MKLVLALTIGAALVFLLYRIWFWRKEGRKLQKSGYLPPRPSLCAHLSMVLITRLLTFLAIGRVKVIGRRNARHKGPMLIGPNHTFELDFAMVKRAVPLRFRYMANADELTGIRGPFGAWTGAFGVDKSQQDAKTAARIACEKVLKQRNDAALLLFPQGTLVRDNTLRIEDFKTGAVRIVREAATTGMDAAILPVALYYNQDPTKADWVTRLSVFFGSFIRKGFKYKNYGGTVVIGKPIRASELPEDPDEATKLLMERIEPLLEQARQTWA